MGVEPYLVASSVEAFVAQRLIRVICPHCKEENTDPLPGIKKEMAASLKLDINEEIKIYRGKGCKTCNYTGYYGRKAIYEILTLNDSIRAAIIEKPRSDYIKRIACREGLVTLRQNGWRVVLDGMTTPDEVLNVSVKDDEYDDTQKEETVSSGGQKLPLEQNKEVRIGRKPNARDEWISKNKYESRSYPRTFVPVEIRYQVVKRDPNDANFLVPEGMEYATKTYNISAAGLSFVSKTAIPIGTMLEVKLQLGEEQKKIVFLAKVCRIEEDNIKNQVTIVNYYLDITSADKAAINKFVEQQIAKEENIEVQ